VYLLKASFKFNARELDEEPLPPLHADNRTIEAEHKIIDAKFFGDMRNTYSDLTKHHCMKRLFSNKILVHI
jgi:hypothetical protein